MGVLILHERLRPLQWVAMGIATTAVVVLTLDYGRLPYVALVLAFTFGSYGLCKKTANVGATDSLTYETAVIAPFAAGVRRLARRDRRLELRQPRRRPLAALHDDRHRDRDPADLLRRRRDPGVDGDASGCCSTSRPILQFALGVLWFHEDMPAGRWAGFVLVWIALVIFTVEAVNHRRRQLRLTVEATAA